MGSKGNYIAKLTASELKIPKMPVECLTCLKSIEDCLECKHHPEFDHACTAHIAEQRIEDWKDAMLDSQLKELRREIPALLDSAKTLDELQAIADRIRALDKPRDRSGD